MATRRRSTRRGGDNVPVPPGPPEIRKTKAQLAAEEAARKRAESRYSFPPTPVGARRRRRATRRRSTRRH